jgi:hypothetical protein
MRKLIALLMLSVIASACGSSEPDPSTGAGRPTGSTSSEGATTAADPLVGEWTQTFTCEDNVAAVDPNLKQYEEWIESNADFWGITGTATLDEPCAGSSEELTRIARIDDGHIVFFDPPTMEPGLDAAYELHGDRISANDGGQNFEGTYVFEFEIDGDELTFELVGRGAKDPWFVSAWEAAPFIRTG